MSLAIKYESVHDAVMRLRGTVVLYKGEPVQIQEIREGTNKDDILRVLINPIPIGKPDARHIQKAEEGVRKYISSKHFDIAPFPMGYLNCSTGKGAVYCTRMPNRVQKQGLCNENFRGLDNYGTPFSFALFVTCPETPLMVAGVYPTFNQALKSLEKVPAVAFSRDFCLVKDDVISSLIYLYHKGVKVGLVTGNTTEVCLGDKFKCLKESLVELGLKVGGC